MEDDASLGSSGTVNQLSSLKKVARSVIFNARMLGKGAVTFSPPKIDTEFVSSFVLTCNYAGKVIIILFILRQYK